MDCGDERGDGDWAENELGCVYLGDQRLTSRLVTLARSLAHAPDMPLPQALPRWGDLKAAYRFFDNAKAVPEHILAGHINATWSRARATPIVLAVQARLTSTGSIIRQPKAWEDFQMPDAASSATARWPSRRNVCRWDRSRNAIGCVMTRRSVRWYRIKNARSGTRKASNGWKASRR